MWFRSIFNPDKTASPAESAAADSGTAGGLTLSPETLRQLNRLTINASRFLPGYTSGMRPSARRRLDLEFREHRMYTPGDDVRFVDWKASARQEHIFVKQGEHHKEASIYVLLDCSASMGWGTPPKSSFALQLAAILGYLALANQDRFFFVPFNHKVLQPLGPLNGKGQAPVLLKTLRGIPFEGETDFTGVGSEFRRRFGHNPGLLLVISDFLNLPDPAALLNLFPAPRWDVVFIQMLHKEELGPALRGDFEIQDSETGRTVNLDITEKAVVTYKQKLQAWRDSLNLACVEKNAFYMHIPTPLQSDLELVTHLRAFHLLKPL